MNARAGDECHRCGHERWASDRYCANCGAPLQAIDDGAAGAGFDLGDSSPRVVDDIGESPWLRIAIAAIVLVGVMGAAAAWLLASRSSSETTQADTELSGETVEDREGVDDREAAVTEGTVKPTPVPTAEAPAEGNLATTGAVAVAQTFTVDKAAVASHDIASARMVLADGNDVKVVDLSDGSVTTLFDDVNFFEIVAIGDDGITAATGFHQAEMVGPGALQYFPYEGESRVVGSLFDFLGGGNVLYTRAPALVADTERVVMHDVTTGDRLEFDIPAGATYMIRGDSLFLEAGNRILRMGSGLADWEQVASGRIEPLPGDGVMVLDCVDETGAGQEPCAIELYRDNGALAVRHERSSPLVQSGALFNRSDTRALSGSGSRIAQLINGGGGGIWDVEAGLISALIPRGVTRVVWTPDDRALIGTLDDDTQLVHVHALTGAGTDLGINAGPYWLVGVTAIAGEDK